ncbi:hypothetical protein IFM89_023880 [Coptis chinensis]|uniref:RRM Nup35-type domain-containing protein n=1 Tax=Coptis chinensis TaxID=261450 RepID=A0A835IF99_9MAGN|nr:hypothetical protein IFM89_023880 [Coptis chinensis]
MSSTPLHRSSTRPSSSNSKSLFFQDLATPISTHRGKFTSPGQAAAVSALWRENFGGTDPPPPPVFTLEDRVDFSPELVDYPDFKTPVLATPLKSRFDASSSYSVKSSGGPNVKESAGWWGSGNGNESTEERGGKGSPVNGVVNSASLITLPPVREVVRPDVQRSSFPVGDLDEEEWVTVYGFSPGDTNLVLREFEKCGTILKHVPGPRTANWMHILYQSLFQWEITIFLEMVLDSHMFDLEDGLRNEVPLREIERVSRFDAHKALSKSGMQINGVLIVGVKLLDPFQRQALSEAPNGNQGFMTLPPASSRTTELIPSKLSPRPYHLQSSSQTTQHSAGVIASPAKSVVSKIVDLMFGI